MHQRKEIRRPAGWVKRMTKGCLLERERKTESSTNLPEGKNAHFEEVPLGLKLKENGELSGKLSYLCLPWGKGMGNSLMLSSDSKDSGAITEALKWKSRWGSYCFKIPTSFKPSWVRKHQQHFPIKHFTFVFARCRPFQPDLCSQMRPWRIKAFHLAFIPLPAQ